MGTRVLEINVISAEVVNDANLFTRATYAYVIVSVNGDGRSLKETPIGTVHGSCCYWNHTVEFARGSDVFSLAFNLKSKLQRRLPYEDVATIEIPFTREMFYGRNGNPRAARSLVTDFRDGEIEGILNFSYNFRDSYRSLVPPSATVYPPHILGYLHLPPPCGGYSWIRCPQPLQGYGYDFEDYYGENSGYDFDYLENFLGDDFEDNYGENYGYGFEDNYEETYGYGFEGYSDDHFKDAIEDHVENYKGDDIEDHVDEYDFCDL